jgi:hypothetical protein
MVSLMRREVLMFVVVFVIAFVSAGVSLFNVEWLIMSATTSSANIGWFTVGLVAALIIAELFILTHVASWQEKVESSKWNVRERRALAICGLTQYAAFVIIYLSAIADHLDFADPRASGGLFGPLGAVTIMVFCVAAMVALIND